MKYRALENNQLYGNLGRGEPVESDYRKSWKDHASLRKEFIELEYWPLVT